MDSSFRLYPFQFASSVVVEVVVVTVTIIGSNVFTIVESQGISVPVSATYRPPDVLS